MTYRTPCVLHDQTCFGHENNTMADGRSLPLTETTLGQRLKALGYATAIAGKWHLGNFAETCPPSVASTITSA